MIRRIIMSTKRIIGVSLIVVCILTGTVVFAVQNYFNPNNVSINTEADKSIMSDVMSALERDNNGSRKKFTKDDIDIEQIYTLYYIDTKKLKDCTAENFESIFIDHGLYYSVYAAKDGSAAMSVVYEKDAKDSTKKNPVSFDSNEGKRVSKIYNEILKNKKIKDIKVLAHPNHETNKLFYITDENDKKYIIPSIVEKRENEVGLISGKKYSVDEIIKNMTDFVSNQPEGQD
jgi:hypothetical protein